MSRLFRIIAKTVSGILIAAIILLAVLLAGVRVVGYAPYTVLSGSMEPAFHVGSVIYVADVDPAELEVGDPLTYRLANGTVVTHRIVEVLEGDKPSDLSFRTKGDANEHADGTPVPAAAVIGRPQFTIPYLGYLSDFIKTRQGLIVVIGLCVLAVLISVLADTIFPKEEDAEEE